MLTRTMLPPSSSTAKTMGILAWDWYSESMERTPLAESPSKFLAKRTKPAGCQSSMALRASWSGTPVRRSCPSFSGTVMESKISRASAQLLPKRPERDGSAGTELSKRLCSSKPALIAASEASGRAETDPSVGEEEESSAGPRRRAETAHTQAPRRRRFRRTITAAAAFLCLRFIMSFLSGLGPLEMGKINICARLARAELKAAVQLLAG